MQDNVSIFIRLNMKRDVDTCIAVSLSRIGNHCVVDASPEEEACSSAALVLAVTPKGRLTTVKKVRVGWRQV